MDYARVAALVASAGLAALVGCQEVQDVCDIGCNRDGLAQGNASITGVKALDGFFAANTLADFAALEDRMAAL